MVEAVLQDMETYVSCHQNTVVKYIPTRTIMGMCLTAKRRLDTRVEMRWEEQEGLDLEGMWKAECEADHTDGAEERDGTDTTKDE